MTALALVLTSLLLPPMAMTAQAQEATGTPGSPTATMTGAQQTTGTPGSPSATTTIEGNQLPPPPQKFGGKIERNAAQSTPYWPARRAAQRRAERPVDHDRRHRLWRL
jgi:hypothetical protein